jgi:nucleotide-binding universal stress UspA family protein
VAGRPGAMEAEQLLVNGDVAARLGAQEVDFLFCGSRGYGLAGQVLLGGTFAKLVRHARSPVVVVPRGAHRPAFHRSSAVEESGR